MNPETKKTFKVAIQLCLVCSIVVSALAVGLKDIQNQQKESFRQQSILSAGSLWEDGAVASDLYKQSIEEVALDLEINDIARTYKPGDKELELDYAERTESLYDLLPPAEDIAGLKKREKYTTVYEVHDNGKLKTLILPIRGKGLWSTLFGFIALDLSESGVGPSGIKVAGLTYYKHGETPGLGGEVDNPLWKEKWVGKLVYDQDWNVRSEVSKSATTEYQVDALSGATLTSNGVTNMLKFWLGDQGFGPYIQKLSGNAKPATDAAEVHSATNHKEHKD